MGKVRIYQLAKELGVENKELLDVIRGLDIEAKSHMSALDEENVKAVTAAVKGKIKKGAAAKKQAAKKPAAAKAAKAERPAKKAAPKAAKPAKKEAAPKAAKPAKKEAAPRAAKPAKKEAAPKTAKAAKEEAPTRPAKPAKMEAAPKAVKAPRKEAAPRPAKAPEKELASKAPAPAATEAAPAAAPPAEPVAVPPVEKKTEDVPVREPVLLSEGITVKELAERAGMKVNEIIKKFLQRGKLVVVNQFLDFDTASDFLVEEGIEYRRVSLEEEGQPEEELGPLTPRAPVVTIMGHVDHGKTSLLDAIRETSVAEVEKGGITQHIGAYHVELPKGNVVFLDTPGHEAFTAMRARGAKVTDIVVLVVAADDGVMPQTVEAIDHSKAAEVPIIVAVNKIDKPEARPDNVKTQLAEHELIPEDWGGETIYVEVSAKQRMGLEDLLEMILLQAEVMELKANPAKPCLGVVVESKIDRGRGPVATVLVQDGKLSVGDFFVTGTHVGKVRALLDEQGKNIREAGPSTPVEVLGLSGVPGPGDSFQVVPDERKARQIASLREQKASTPSSARPPKVSLQDLFSRISEGVVKELPIIVKGDVQGSVEALSEALQKLSTEAVKVNVIHRGVGTINEGDILLAAASNALVIGFNVRPEPKVSDLAAREGVDMRFYNIIYKATEDVQNAMLGLLEPTFREEFQGRAEVRETFSVPKVGIIAGCGVMDGKITRTAEVRVLRDGIVVYEGKIGSLRRFKDDVKEVASGYECGIGIENFNDVKKGDVFETFIQVKEQPKL